MAKSLTNKQSYSTGIRVFGLFFAALFLTGCSNVELFQPKGPVARDEALLISTAFALMLIVVIPVFVLAIWIAIRYRASGNNADYRPEWAKSMKLEFLIWSVPIAIVLALAWLSWTSTYRLDPYKPIPSEAQPLRVEVVSLDWKWLFIYPDYHVATVNEIVLPANTPLNFRLTSATVMTSFFIPQLGSQMYAMAGMQTQLHLLADETGVFDGHNQEFSGTGYATMHFKAVVTTPEQFNAWIQNARKSPKALSMAEYEALNEPGGDHPVTIYSSVESGLFDRIVGQFTGWKNADAPMKPAMQQKATERD
ncbi:ubiquinol oxidase subunit II [Chlorobaculum sp. MV4-Y]|uniref:ubiquinol oxidase subunit II n=1 Tax=Chlorobaculum sp. MV4-Y TaxID=2976335 RepID=UPI0021B019FA|nr:ubiquinol oxidase subunit II [Chlorobaculum sp. MV4-Y]UWX58399.1 ubiquinol oxidase subunit II [Chlorobaculum sp. MV4-Y]